MGLLDLFMGGGSGLSDASAPVPENASLLLGGARDSGSNGFDPGPLLSALGMSLLTSTDRRTPLANLPYFLQHAEKQAKERRGEALGREASSYLDNYWGGSAGTSGGGGAQPSPASGLGGAAPRRVSEATEGVVGNSPALTRGGSSNPAIENRFISAVRDNGLTNPYGLAAAAAYARAESGYKPGNITGSWSDPSERGEPGTSGGILSWRGPRLAAMRDFTKGASDPVEAQARFFLAENPALTEALQNARSPEQAHSLMANAWKFAGYNRQGGEAQRRLEATRSYLDRVGGGSSRTADLPGPGARTVAADMMGNETGMPMTADGFVIPPAPRSAPPTGNPDVAVLFSGQPLGPSQGFTGAGTPTPTSAGGFTPETVLPEIEVTASAPPMPPIRPPIMPSGPVGAPQTAMGLEAPPLPPARPGGLLGALAAGGLPSQSASPSPLPDLTSRDDAGVRQFAALDAAARRAGVSMADLPAPGAREARAQLGPVMSSAPVAAQGPQGVSAPVRTAQAGAPMPLGPQAQGGGVAPGGQLTPAEVEQRQLRSIADLNDPQRAIQQIPRLERMLGNPYLPPAVAARVKSALDHAMRVVAPTERSRQLVEAGYRPGTPEYQAAYKDLLNAQRTPMGYRRSEDGSRLEAIPGGPADTANQREKPPTGYRAAPGGGFEFIPGGPADPSTIRREAEARQGAKGKNLSQAAIKSLGQAGAMAADFDRLSSTFADDFAGYRIGALGDAANTAGRNVGGKYAAQAEWWQGYQAVRNQVRNQLFGATLTASEKSEFDKADINPGMTPDMIRRNLNRQLEIKRAGMARLAAPHAAQGIDPAEIEGALGYSLESLGVGQGGRPRREAPAGDRPPSQPRPPAQPSRADLEAEARRRGIIR